MLSSVPLQVNRQDLSFSMTAFRLNVLILAGIAMSCQLPPSHAAPGTDLDIARQLNRSFVEIADKVFREISEYEFTADSSPFVEQLLPMFRTLPEYFFQLCHCLRTIMY